MSEFVLHPQLQKDGIWLGDFELSRVLLINDSQFPWLVLVPMQDDIGDIYQLDSCQQAQFWRESKRLSEALIKLYKGDKLNLAALGNMVPQLHVHHVVRYHNDPLWPQPIWGKLPAKPYSEQEKAQQVAQLHHALAPLWQLKAE
ncbi:MULTISPECIES: HIT domain-containing protein [unclassified Agarivorans]|uniref:HIT domain-containing protein n=1 Tax=unclassified Agarivorans TaxID=2636026 RepID=UPI0010DDCA87|nr:MULTISPECIES: HIT domain-containing protein [unclassified Agarivorans]MDO6685790.1 HIT domain-containing protein [Agarivorans sp. 3_MG-2023]MDO6716095.1 HIT domain-containing protein [Agarivorans sp. 2_MG-2023]MDO6764261.1 HIT domain-containing protein [Agarivorans sp. 1_MG-2023]GDY26345.1 histidine triad domain protein [Agarivorans sp. Toyoura001]